MRIVLAIALCIGIPVSAGTIGVDLEQALIDAGPDDFLPVVVMMEEFPAPAERLNKLQGLNRRDRRARVVADMRGLAERSQRPLRAALAAERSGVRHLRTLWGINGLAFEARPGVIDRIATLPGIRRVHYDGGAGRPAEGAGTSGGEPALTGPTGGDASGPNPDATIRGEVVAMGAPDVWDQLGYTGVGVIVAVLDTGVDPSHPDLADHIWTNLGEVAGNAIDDDGNGYVDDTWGWDFCDNDNVPISGNHGTQVAGQVAGDGTGGVVTGMAPDAELMVLGFDCTPSDSIGWEASDYAIAMGADIITESFIWPWDTSDMPDYEGWRRQMETELAAGVIHANAAGNDGQNVNRVVPYEVGAPANSPPPWRHPDQTLVGALSSVIAVGNISWGSDVIASSSSRGPSAWEDIVTYTWPGYPHSLTPSLFDYPYQSGAQMGLIRPDISAYGNGTSTTCVGGGYCGFSGTSSATPHVSGVLALMLQSNPDATPAELAEAIMTTAEHRGDPGKNNVYGTGLLQALPAVQAVESGVVYFSHAFDDSTGGNGDLGLDPGETVQLQLTIESRTDVPLNDVEAILTTTTPGVTIHDRRATFPGLAPGATAQTDAPHFWVSLDPAACSTIAVFDFEFRYGTSVRRGTFDVRIGDEEAISLIDSDFETASGWVSDPGTTTRGAFVREDPIGVFVENTTTPANPENDTTLDPGNTCWVTGNGELTGKKDENNNDVDNGTATLTSPLFGAPHILELSLSYDRWYFDDSSGGDSFFAELSNDGGMNWTTVEQLVNSSGGWGTQMADALLLLPPSTDMLLRFRVTDGSDDTAVEGAVDEVHVDGMWVNCQDYTPPAALAPNPVGDTLTVSRTGSHVELSWQAPPLDGGHDAASLYRVERAGLANGTFDPIGSSTTPGWFDIDATAAPAFYYYLVTAENGGGTE